MRFNTMTRFLREYVSTTEVQEMSASDVNARLGEPGFHVLDCNWELVWRRGHVPGAVYVGFDTLPTELLPADLDATLVFYCANAL